MAQGRRGGAIGSFFSFIWLLVIAALAVAVFLIWEIHRPGPTTQATSFTVEKGEGAMTIAKRLQKQGIVRNAYVFRIATELYVRKLSLKAGEYEVKPADSVRQIVERIESGRMLQLPITVPEGLTSRAVVELLANDFNLTGPIPPVPPEGRLLPETYMMPRNAQRSEVIARMEKDQQELVAALWAKRAADLPVKTPEEAVILASVVEKETGIASERPLVASVFVNRLRKGIRLESDPTIIYGVCLKKPERCKGGRLIDEKGQPRSIRQSEIALDTGYNTYRIDALPPTPICNPGKDALAAVMNPPETDKLFFVALDPSNPRDGHAFSATLAEHTANVAKLRAAEQSQSAAKPH